MRGKMAALLMMAALLGAGCAAGQRPKQEVKACGTESQRHGEGYDAVMRDCLWQAYQAKQPATFTSVKLTIEGDPITATVSVDEQGRVKVVYDTTKDNFGDKKVTTYSCKVLQRREIDSESRMRLDFMARQCTGGENQEIWF